MWLRSLSKMMNQFSLFVTVVIFIASAKSASVSRANKLKTDLSVQSDPKYVEDVMRISKAGEMLNYMNESVDPCDNFYNFACGNWAQINPANSIEHVTTGLLEKLAETMNRKLEEMLKTKTETIDTEVEKKVKQFYKSCVNIRNLKKDYNKSLKVLMSEFGEMPALVGDQWDETQFDWVDVVGRIAYKYGVSSLVSFDILPDFTNNTINRLYFGQPEFLLETKSMYMSNLTAPYRDVYRQKIKKDLVMFLDLDEELATKTANEIVQFETSLAEGMMDETLGLDINESSTLTTLEELQQRYAPTIDMVRLVNLTMGKPINDPIYEYVEQYQINLKKILEITPKRTVANYVFFMLLTSFAQKPSETAEKQEKDCIRITKKYFSKNLDNMIYRRYNTKATENDIDLMWQKIKTTFKKTLESGQMDWIRKETRQYALQKLDAMKLEINSYATENFAEEFDALVLTDNDFIKNLANVLELSAQQEREELYQPPKAIDAGEILSYSPANIILENRIKVPVSLLQPYFLWAASYPNAVKFGSLASLIGHELIHGFDDTGRKFDKDGNSKDWWDELSAASFVTRTQCFVNQYSHYMYNGRLLTRSASQSENIADNGGVSLAYAAYLDWYEEAVRTNQNLSLETLPSLNYTSKQLFFISYAQVWCNDAHPKVRDLQTSTDSHMPGKFRVIGPLSNFPEFAKEFNCAAGKPMNPNNKCKIY